MIVSNKYILSNVLGIGNAKVYNARRLDNYHNCACKVIPKISLDIKQHSNVMNEVNIMKRLKGHKHIIEYEDFIEDNNSYYIFMQKYAGSDLYSEFSKNGNQMTESNTLKTIEQCLKAVCTCHDSDVIHNDIKPQNFLYTSEICDNVVLIDFGISMYESEIDDKYVFSRGTPLYCSPEALQSKLSKKSDVWSIGVMAHLLLTGRFPFFDKTNSFNPCILKIWNAIYKDSINFNSVHWKDISDDTKHFVSMLLEKDVKKRMNSNEALEMLYNINYRNQMVLL